MPAEIGPSQQCHSGFWRYSGGESVDFSSAQKKTRPPSLIGDKRARRRGRGRPVRHLSIPGFWNPIEGGIGSISLFQR
jgi:hypothetical protein